MNKPLFSTLFYFVCATLDINITHSTCVKATLAITLHQEKSLNARCTMEDGKGNLVGG